MRQCQITRACKEAGCEGDLALRKNVREFKIPLKIVPVRIHQSQLTILKSDSSLEAAMQHFSVISSYSIYNPDVQKLCLWEQQDVNFECGSRLSNTGQNLQGNIAFLIFICSWYSATHILVFCFFSKQYHGLHFFSLGTNHY